MSRYRRNWNRNEPTKVLLHWNIKSSAYSLKFNDTYHWNEMQPFLSYLKTLPYGEYEYDPETKIWYFAESYLVQVQSLFETMKSANIFEVDFQEKPANQTYFNKFVPIDIYFDKFAKLSGEDIRNKEYNDAKKLYRRVCLRMHPDKGGDSNIMSEINEAWLNIETNFYKIKKEIEYV